MPFSINACVRRCTVSSTENRLATCTNPLRCIMAFPLRLLHRRSARSVVTLGPRRRFILSAGGKAWDPLGENKKGAASDGAAPLSLSLYCALRFHDFQFVLYGESAEDLVGAHSGHLLVHRAVDRAVKGHMPVHYDDANRACRINRVLAQHRVTIDDPHRPQAHLVIEDRNRLKRNVV